MLALPSWITNSLISFTVSFLLLSIILLISLVILRLHSSSCFLNVDFPQIYVITGFLTFSHLTHSLGELSTPRTWATVYRMWVVQTCSLSSRFPHATSYWMSLPGCFAALHTLHIQNEAGHVLSSASYPQQKVSSPMRFPSHSWFHTFSHCPSCGVFANTNLFSESAATALSRNMLDTQVLEPQLRPTESVHLGAGPGISI